MSEAERRPLLGGLREREQVPVEADEAVTAPVKLTPLPKVELGVLCLLRTLDPMAFSQIFPYINEFVRDLNVVDNPNHIGLYSGLVESTFAISQLMATYPWGRASDKYGRRPVVLVGVMGLAISTLLFGLAKSFASLLAFRFVGGLFSGNISVIPTILIEITDKTNQASAFPFFGIWWPVGAIIGPLLGGLLSSPATRYPKIFDVPFFRRYPYFLPGAVVSQYALLCFVVSWLLLPETRKHKPEQAQYNPIPSADSSDSDASIDAPQVGETSTIHRVLSNRVVRSLCISALALSFVSNAFEVLFVLFCFYPVSQGGLGFPVAHIGMALATGGFLSAILQAVFMPTILRRVNHSVMYHFCMRLWPVCFMLLPFLNLIARSGNVRADGTLDVGTTHLLWVGMALVLSITRVAYLCYSLNMLVLKAAVSDSSLLGSTTGLLQFCINMSRAVGPACSSMLFTYSLGRSNFLHGSHLWVVVMVLLGLVSTRLSRDVVVESRKACLA